MKKSFLINAGIVILAAYGVARALWFLKEERVQYGNDLHDWFIDTTTAQAS